MGLLDDLKRQSEARKLDEERDAAQRSELENRMRTTLVPRMRTIFNYLIDLIEQLNYLQPTIHTQFEVRNFGTLRRLQQKAYQLTRLRPETEIEHGFALRWLCASKAKHQISTLSAKDTIAQREWFQKHGIPFDCSERKNDNYEVVGATFTFNARVVVRLSFEPDPERMVITMGARNYDRPGRIYYDFDPTEIDDAFLDDLGRYIVRETNMLPDRRVQNISAEQRAVLRAKLEEERQSRMQEFGRDDSGKPSNRSSPVQGLLARLGL